MNDYALVVGISHYPKFDALGALMSLAGPENDATAVATWLLDPQGGGLQRQNLRLIRSSDFPGGEELPQPTMSRINAAMQWLMHETRQRAGGRLYMYFAGHGFAPVLEEPALFTAEADDQFLAHMFVYDWYRWFRQAGRFKEYVLLVDCCMTHQRSITPSPIMAPNEVSAGTPGPSFMACAAQTKSALERLMDDGLVHGIFTWSLLKGLYGGAADEHGVITSESLKAFLHDTMPQLLPESAQHSLVVDLHPFVRSETAFAIKRLEAQPTLPARLIFPASTRGARMRIWSGSPHRIIEQRTIDSTSIVFDLTRGLYVAEVAEVGLRQGFQVTGVGGTKVVVEGHGPTVTATQDRQALHRLEVRPSNPAASLSLTDSSLRIIHQDTGAIDLQLRPGVYKIRIEIGRDVGSVSEQIILLDDDVDDSAEAPPVPTPAPLAHSVFGKSRHRKLFLDAAWRHGGRPPLPKDCAGISVLGRFWFPPDRPSASRLHPLAGLELRDWHGRYVEQFDTAPIDPQSAATGPLSLWERALPGGTYYLRHRFPDGKIAEATVIATTGWITQIALQREPGIDGEPFPEQFRLRDAAVFMRPPGAEDQGEQQDLVIEAARIALTQGRNPLRRSNAEKLERLLLETYDDPIATIIGGYLLLHAAAVQELDPHRIARFDEAVTRLREILGFEHPDVEVLSLRCADPWLRHHGPIATPPIFKAGWKLLTDASYEDPGLIPDELWKRIHATTSLGPFLAWAVDDDSKLTHSRQLDQWLTPYAYKEVELPQITDVLGSNQSRLITQSLPILSLESAAASQRGDKDPSSGAKQTAPVSAASARAARLRGKEMMLPAAVVEELLKNEGF